MRNVTPILFACALATATVTPLQAQTVPDLTVAKDLLLPCQEADNDPRDGFIAELECVSFIRGFMAAVDLSDLGKKICLPDANRDDQVRRAFAQWVHGSFRKRGNMPVGDAILEALNDKFPCG
ncbi:Rap1a/Tai family immunity protein [Aliiroseovarius subalbicans]|uniref:Rap1a/Tai family immunity protein n=1 Tax=Aliiroseovarius subalbicans TaxID=2925840 RepID=UPI001F567854|nr:Rap1a/Tai family immunity protein [Aliiroseovarius subalbicans]MCI2399649.1 hypothetical protein [Aliiroseovarius subalbicans]